MRSGLREHPEQRWSRPTGHPGLADQRPWRPLSYSHPLHRRACSQSLFSETLAVASVGLGASWLQLKLDPAWGVGKLRGLLRHLTVKAPKSSCSSGVEGQSPRPCCLGTGHGVQGQDLFLAEELGAAGQQRAWGLGFCWAGSARPSLTQRSAKRTQDGRLLPCLRCTHTHTCSGAARAASASSSEGGAGGQAGQAATCAHRVRVRGLCSQGPATPPAPPTGPLRASLQVVTFSFRRQFSTSGVQNPTLDPGE